MQGSDQGVEGRDIYGGVGAGAALHSDTLPSEDGPSRMVTCAPAPRMR